jgi:hypothetical protein
MRCSGCKSCASSCSSSTENSLPPQFEKFLKLPTEIRLMIWKYTLPGPRTITIMRKDVHWKQVLKRMMVEGYADPVTGAVAVTTVPAILHVSFEAREYAQKYYKLSFSDYLIYKPIYFNFNIDTLYFDGPGSVQEFLVKPPWESSSKNHTKLKHKNTDELSQIKYLAYYGAYNCMEEIVGFMTALEKFTTMIPYYLDTPIFRRSLARILSVFWITARVKHENIPKIEPVNRRQLAHKKVFELTGYKPKSYKRRITKTAPWLQRTLEKNVVAYRYIILAFALGIFFLSNFATEGEVQFGVCSVFELLCLGIFTSCLTVEDN